MRADCGGDGEVAVEQQLESARDRDSVDEGDRR